MNQSPSRLRMIAGPNGSGKTTLKQIVQQELSGHVLGVDLNPDEIERDIRKQPHLALSDFGVTAPDHQVVEFYQDSAFLRSKGLQPKVGQIRCVNGVLDFANIEVNSYIASVTVALIREQLLETRKSFVIETVMSSKDKVSLLERAQSKGFRTYLYYVATEDPELNVGRVKQRVIGGGHDVPEDKVRSRYARSLDLLSNALVHTNRAYLFDNSGAEPLLLAEVTEGKRIALKSDAGPAWFQKYVLDKMDLEQSDK